MDLVPGTSLPSLELELELLYVDGNKLGGTLPKNIGALESLREFQLYRILANIIRNG